MRPYVPPPDDPGRVSWWREWSRMDTIALVLILAAVAGAVWLLAR